MTIPSQLPQIVTAARSGALQALALQAGQMLDGKVLGAAPNGGTQVEIRGQLLNLLLPVALKAGDTVRLEVQGTGAQLRLALQPQAPPARSPTAPASPAPAAPGPQASSIPLQQPAAPQATTPTPQNPSTQPALPPNQPVQQGVSAPQVNTPAAPQAPPSAAATVGVTARSPQALPVSPGAATPTAPAPAPPVMPPPQAAAPTGMPPLPVSSAVQPASMPVSIAPAGPAQTGSAPAPAAPVPVVPYPQSPAPPSAPTAAPSAPLAQPAAASPARPTLPGATPVAVPPSLPATPQAALAQMVHAAVPRQGAVTDLTSALANLAGKVVLPEPVARAAQQIMAGRVAIDAPRFNGASLQAAVRGSGVFQEAGLARGQLPLPQADMKSALLALRQTLTTWLGSQAPVAAIAHLAPPLKGNIPRARGGEAPPIDPAVGPEEVGKQLLDRTESALARVRLHQHASLPDTIAKTADWSMDLPVMIGQQQTLMQIQIHRDQQGDTETPGERGWQMRFALSLPGMGEVGAQVSMRAGATGIMLWASEAESAAALDAEIGSLRQDLISAGLKPSAVIVRQGGAPQPQTAPSGHFLDERT